MPRRSTKSAPAPEEPSRGAGTKVSDDALLLEHGHSTSGTVNANTALGDPFNTRVRSNARGEVWKELQKQTPPSEQSSEPSPCIPPDVMRVLQKCQHEQQAGRGALPSRGRKQRQNERDAESDHQSILTIMSNGEMQTFDFSGMDQEQKIAAAADAVQAIGGTCPGGKSPPPFFPKSDCPLTVNEVYHLYCKMAKHGLKFTTTQERESHIMEFLPLMLNCFNELATRPKIGTFFFNIKTAILLADPQLGDPEDPRSDFLIKHFGELENGQIAAIYHRKTGRPHKDPALMRSAMGISSMLIEAYLKMERFTTANYTYRMLQKKVVNHKWVHIMSEPKGDSILLHPMFEDFKRMNFTIDYSPAGATMPALIRFRDVSMPDRRTLLSGDRNEDPSTRFDEYDKEAEKAAERNAADLLSELEQEEAASKSDAMRKSAKNRATKLRKKKKKASDAFDPNQLDSIAEDDVHVQADDEPARCEAGEAGEVPEHGAEVVADVPEVFNLSEIGSALTPKDDDVATSVATALMCVICMSEEKSIACVPCGHKCLCEGCGNHDIAGDTCPMCRETIGMFMRVFE
jgi:hypothetical protein